MKFLSKKKSMLNLIFLIVAISLLVGCSSKKDEVYGTKSNGSISRETSSSDASSSSYSSKENSTENQEDSNIEDNDNEEDNKEYYEDNNYDDDDSYSSSNSSNYQYDEDSYEDSHIGEKVYIANGNSYYHKISNCKYLEGASTKKIVLSENLDKYECNCFENPVEYVPEKSSSKKHHSENHSLKHSSKSYVYIAKGNSYYHKSPNCKFIKGASVSKVNKSSASGKYPCNCVKY